jgi:cytochrome d ubiquinol oxidase subunit II
MGTLWFCLVALMLVIYVLLDGFDIGAGIVHLGVARTDDERRTVLRTIGPVWDGNEVWLIAAGGTLFFAFPTLYASSFSGFYLPLMIVLWLLIIRGIAIELRGHVQNAVWAPFWDHAFAFSSILLALFFGAALGNVVRGVPLDATGYFFEPLWTDLKLGPDTGILDWYTILVGILALAALTMHGALWIAMKTEAEVQRRSRRIAGRAWWGIVALTVATTIVTFRIQPQVLANLAAHPWGYVFPALVVIGLLEARVLTSAGRDLKAFLASSAYLAGMLASVAFGLYPNVLPARNAVHSLTIDNAKAADYGLKIGLVWWAIGMVLVAGYFVFTYRRFAGKVRLEEE